MATDRKTLVKAKDALSRLLLSPPATAPLLPVLDNWREEMKQWTPRSLTLSTGLEPHPGYRSLRQQMRAIPPVAHAVGIGRKMIGGHPTEIEAIRVYVTHKADLPRRHSIPRRIEGVPTDVIEAPPASFLSASVIPCSQNRAGRTRPVIGGVSTSHTAGDTGTIGYFCRSTDPADSPNDTFVLGAAHVYAALGVAARGDDLLQAGTLDGGAVADRIAAFHRAVPLQFNGPDNFVDAAIGRLVDVPFVAEICTIGKVTGAATAAYQDVVAKHGRTTGYTEGTVTDDLIDFVMLPHNSPNFIRFKNQMRLAPRPPYAVIARDGDSGSLAVKKGTGVVLGLLHAAAIDGSYAYANHIAEVMTRLKVALV